MRRKRTLQELTIKDNFMFGAVMSDENNCRRLLELILQFPIERVVVSKEKSMIYHPEYKGVRLDVYAQDENNTHYDVEMQAVSKKALGRRARYYHSQIDMDLLLSGELYQKLPNTYVIFICDFDPFGEAKYCYTFANQCLENPMLNQGDGSKSIFLSTKGTNKETVPEAMVKFLQYVAADLSESTKNFQDDFVENIQRSVQHIKQSREMEGHFMFWEQIIRDEKEDAREEGLAEGRVEGRAQGRAQAVLELLEDLGSIPEDVQTRILAESDLEILRVWNKVAAKSDSIEQFLQNM